jgi:uncharacterized Zn finger protein
MEVWCDYCGDEQEVVKTVSWQPNHCAECGNQIEAS